MATLTMDEGEWATVAVDFTGLEAPWDDLTSATVTLHAERRTPAPVTVMTPVAGALDAAGTDGKVHGAYALVPSSWTAGKYFATITISKAGSGWPQKQSLDIEVKAVAPAA